MSAHERASIPFTFSEVRLPEYDGIELLCRIRTVNSDADVALFTEVNPTALAVAAVKAGAVDFLEKPLDRSRLVELACDAARPQAVASYRPGLKRLFDRYDLEGIVCRSPAFYQTLELAVRVAPLDCTVLITGQSGSGKEIVAKAIHRNSLRHDKPFVSINCAAIPDGLLESELFGYKRGAFTGAMHDKAGLLEKCRGGTVFLDEIGEMSPTLQAKLLRFLENHTFYPVGAVEPVEADVRVIAATNAQLERMVETGKFREDLYYRLHVVPVRVPALSERSEDIFPLAQHFLSQLTGQVGKRVAGLSREAVGYLKSTHWKGNVRQLANAIEYAVIVSRGNLLTSQDFRKHDSSSGVVSVQAATTRSWSLPAEGLDLEALVKSLTLQALERSDYSITAAAGLLGITRATLKYRIRKYGFKRPGPGRSEASH